MHVIVFTERVAEARRSVLEPVVVEVEAVVALAVAVVGVDPLGGIPEEGEVLAVQVADHDVVLAELVGDVVEPAVGVLLQAPEPGQVVLVDVVVAGAEEPYPELVVLEQEPAEIRGERLDPEAHAVEVEAVRDVAEMHIQKQLLHPGMGVVAGLPLARVDIEHPQLLHLGVVEVEDRRDVELVVGGTEHRVALEEDEGQDQVIVEQELIAVPEGIEGIAATAHLGCDRRRHAPQLRGHVVDDAHVEEPIAVEGAVGLQDVAVIGVVPGFLHEVQVLGQAPAVRDRQEIAGCGRRRERDALQAGRAVRVRQLRVLGAGRLGLCAWTRAFFLACGRGGRCRGRGSGGSPLLRAGKAA